LKNAEIPNALITPKQLSHIFNRNKVSGRELQGRRKRWKKAGKGGKRWEKADKGGKRRRKAGKGGKCGKRREKDGKDRKEKKGLNQEKE
jgi:hypothetical protein